jgi:hypothetical protein
VAIVVLLTVVASALVPDLLFDRLDVPLPLFWGTVCALTAAGLLVPRRLRA